MVSLFYSHPVLTGLTVHLLLTGGLIVSMLAGLRTRGLLKEGEESGPSIIENSVFAVFGLLIAFTFSGATERFTARRGLIVEESQAASAAWDQLGLLPEPARKALREKLCAYLDAKLATFVDLQSVEELEGRLAAQDQLGRELIAGAVEVVRSPEGQAFGEILIPPLSELRALAIARVAAMKQHPPTAIYLFLICLALVCAFFCGWALHQAGRWKWVYILAFALSLATALYITIDLEFPRMGMIRADGADEFLRNVRNAMR